MAISVVDPLERAWVRMVRVCFRPFRFRGWLVIGFCAFLAYLGEGGGGQFMQGVTHALVRGLGNAAPWPALLDALRRNLPVVIGVGGGVSVFLLAATVLIMWVQARGQFMLLDNVVYERPAVREPWRKYAGAANSLWRFNVGVLLITVATTLATFGVAGVVAWPAIEMQQMTEEAVWAAMGSIIVLVPLWLLYWKVLMVNTDFIVPMMFASELTAYRAWGVWLRQFLARHMWVIILFYLMKLLLGLAAGAIATMAVCLTCLLGALPYVSSVLLLPVLVFWRCYSAYFVEQFGEGWRVFPIKAEAPTCPGCGYDLRGNPWAAACPECGYKDPLGLGGARPAGEGPDTAFVGSGR